jgi:hypothetical protein
MFENITFSFMNTVTKFSAYGGSPPLVWRFASRFLSTESRLHWHGGVASIGTEGRLHWYEEVPPPLVRRAASIGTKV